MKSGYLDAWKSGLLVQRIAESRELLSPCRLCPRQCGVDRLAGERGYCRIGLFAEVASYAPHFGEETVLVGDKGSGTIFFCGCNLLCAFCQNFEISHSEPGSCREVDDRQLAAIMVQLQQEGCCNINFVTPSHVLPQILSALPFAIDQGLKLPLVYNCSGYEEVASLQLLEGIVDIYMPDFKFWHRETARRYAQAPDYPEKARAALVEMQRQVGDLQVGGDGLAQRGLLVRHLLMPGGREETNGILRFIAEKISRDCYLNIMDQYRPSGRIAAFAELQEPLAHDDYRLAVAQAGAFGLTRLDQRDFGRLLRLLLR